ncbi:MAG: rRNA cytosine-C5-methyltransferase [Dysgonamonadaceae bacterium]|jgi:16S rRNA C967 or C1407 C5-methylase (RsmB/RsmF family)/NOL1/NOP2/fmu family ribosome biogenesis protein|nr:rRNA cytosine-C5-methyltransferase [Dysgonamonadaceae bacterium]
MNLPSQFVSRTKALLGNEWPAFESALNAESPVSIRLNRKKLHVTDYESQEPQIISGKVPWATDAFYLKSRPVFTLDPLFHAGCYYIQEASSMFLEHFIRQYVCAPVRALDLCAAPGGKATHLSSVLPEGSLLVANEVIRSRVPVLVENLVKWGNPDTVVINSDSSEIGRLTGFFDIIVCDLPCSGEGMFRKNPASVAEWSVENVQLCSERQRRIVADVFPALKPGGILIYSTCTYNREENEENIDRICNELGAELLEPPRRFMIHMTKGEGFFIAGMRKLVNISNPDCLRLNSLKIIYDGRETVETWKKYPVPPHALAMSTGLPKNAFPSWELDRQTALEYLHRDVLRNIPADIPKGFVLVTYKNQPLGFVKNIGTRANNLYPNQWRIRMAIPIVGS